jgi:XisH protein
MPARDKFHDAVKHALIKEEWTITHDPYTLDFGFTEAYIDLGAEKLLAAEKGKDKIAVEIKSFLGSSNLYEFHTAIGQFINYKAVLRREEPDRILFLAVPKETFDNFFQQKIIAELVTEHQLKIIVYNSDNEVLIQWIK